MVHWTPQEDARLIAARLSGLTFQRIADEQFGGRRTKCSVHCRWDELRDSGASDITPEQIGSQQLRDAILSMYDRQAVRMNKSADYVMLAMNFGAATAAAWEARGEAA